MKTMERDQEAGSTWASVVAVMALAGTVGVLYLPLVFR
jgi:hypothetical protein